NAAKSSWLFPPRASCQGGLAREKEGAMKGAAARIGTLAIAVCVVAGAARADEPSNVAGASRAGERTDLTDPDRAWVNCTREAPGVGDKQCWIELRGMYLADDQGISQRDSAGVKFHGPTLNLAGYPVNAQCTIGGNPPCVEAINGSRYELIGAYGL